MTSALNASYIVNPPCVIVTPHLISLACQHTDVYKLEFSIVD